jgi:pimeloyl-ACP methyl ester carboxylesterase
MATNEISKDPDTHGELVSFRAADKVRLHGALFTNGRAPQRDIAVISTHGAANSFYGSVTGFLSPRLASRGYPTLSMNLRCHDRAYATSIFEDCEKDFAAGVQFMKELGYRKFVLFGHSLSVTQIIYYMARSQEPSVLGLALSAGHYDLREGVWRSWETLADDPKAAYDRVLDECRGLVARGDGDRLIIIPWWRPDPKLKLRQTYREISAQTFLSYRSPESKCNASAFVGEVSTPSLYIAHSIVDTTASPEMMKRLYEMAAPESAAEYVEIEGSGHFYAGYEDQLTDVIATWIERGPAKQATAAHARTGVG